MIPKRRFGPTNVEVPVIGQGTWQLRDRQAALEALKVGLDLGMTHIDTAELYTGSEQVVGEAIRGRREQVFLVSKVLPRHASYEGTLKACEQSLARLGTDHLDVYLLHWNDGSHPISETMRAMGELIDQGKIRWAGVSNFDVDELEEAKGALGAHRLACNQVLYHLEQRGVESDVLPWCKRNRVALVGYSPFGSTNGFPSPKSKGGRALEEVAKRLGKTPRQVALAFLARDPDAFLIPKAEKAEHVRDNAAALAARREDPAGPPSGATGGAFALPKEAIETLDHAFPMKPGIGFL